MTRSRLDSAMPRSAMNICRVLVVELGDLHLDLAGQRVDLDSGRPNCSRRALLELLRRLAESVPRRR